MNLQAMAVHFPSVPGHPNKVTFEGILTLVDTPSDKPPSGAKGHRVILSHAAAEAALPSLLGMAVDFTPSWDGHDAQRKCGILTSAELFGKELAVGGYLFLRDFPEIEEQLAKAGSNAMGMSYEIADAHVQDLRCSVWTLEKVTFTGAAILLREKAAYRSTAFHLGSGKQWRPRVRARARIPKSREHISSVQPLHREVGAFQPTLRQARPRI